VAVNSALLPSIAATGFGVAFLHAALPTHWLPFVLAGRGQGWGRTKTLSVAVLSGLGHVLFTALLGVLVVWLGLETSRATGDVFVYIASGVLLLFGSYYLLRHDGPHRHLLDLRFRRSGVAGGRGSSVEGTTRPTGQRASDKAVILGLLTTLTLSPCESFLPVYLAGIGYGAAGFLLLSAVLTGATLAGMVAFTWIAIASLDRLEVAALERYESAILGTLLCLLGVLVLVLER
jgi:hypothetical protein